MGKQDFKNQFGEVLRGLRKIKEMTQEEIAPKVGVALKTFCTWDRGQALPTVDKYFLLIEVLGEELHTNLLAKVSSKA